MQVCKELGFQNQSSRLHLHLRIYPGIQGARIQELELQVASTLENISRYTRSQDKRARAPGCIYSREYIQVYKVLGYKNQSSSLHLHLTIYPGIQGASILELELQVASTLENISRQTRNQDTRTRAPGCIYSRESIQIKKELEYRNQSSGLHLHQRIYPDIQGARIQELELQVTSTLENISR